MRALQFSPTVPRFLIARSLGRLTEKATFGSLGALRLKRVREPSLPGPQWVLLEVIAAGICGTDLGNLTFHASPILEPFASFPSVPGHEILARVVEVGEDVRRVAPGDRVAVDPLLSCRIRGHPPGAECPSCEEGLPATCGMAGEDGELELGGRALRRGITIGYHADLPGGWGERVLAHESQLYPLDTGISNRAGVLVEPLSVGVHTVLAAPPRPGEDALVIGSGPIAFGAIWALRALGFEGGIVAQTKRAAEAEIARALGASDVVTPGGEAREALVARGGRAYQPLLGPEVFAGGGFPYVLDCVGTAGSIGESFRFAAPRGRVLMLGCAAEVKKLDLTLLWARELEVRGFFGYGRERWRGRDFHTFDVTLELLREGAGAGAVERLVTHAFSLDQYGAALSAAANRRRSGAVKVVLLPGKEGLSGE